MDGELMSKRLELLDDILENEENDGVIKPADEPKKLVTFQLPESKYNELKIYAMQSKQSVRAVLEGCIDELLDNDSLLP